MANSRICSVTACDKPHYAKGWCNKHWQRWRAHGDPLGGGISPGTVTEYLETVVMAYDGHECLIWPHGRNKAGYAILNRGSGTTNIVSRYVCEMAHGPAPTPRHEAAHSCGKGHEGCVAKRHVAWKTPKQNAKDKRCHGRMNWGERNGSAKLTESDVMQIRALRGKVMQKDIAVMFGVSHNQVCQILSGRNWAHI